MKINQFEMTFFYDIYYGLLCWSALYYDLDQAAGVESPVWKVEVSSVKVLVVVESAQL